jgi:hypothetical protein
VQGKPRQARDVLAAVYGWLSEGLDTNDLLEARRLLNEPGQLRPTYQN